MTQPLTTEYGPCDPWPIFWNCDVSCESPVVTARAAQFATELLWSLTGRQFGLCTVTLRPCRRDCFDAWPYGWFEFMPSVGGMSYPQPALIGGRWFNLVCGGCGDSCSCSRVSEALLPAPVHSIVEVKVDGTPLVTGAYRVDDARLLVRTDGGEWPRCNDLNLADTQPGTWSVTARYGQSVPEGGAWAMGELACQFIQAQTGADCRLPRSVTQLIRQGVTIQFNDVLDLVERGYTGLYLVDSFIRTWNPSGLRQRSRTYSVDGPRPRRTNT